MPDPAIEPLFDSRIVAETLDASDIDAVLDAIWRMTALPFTDDDRYAISVLAIRAIRARENTANG